MACSRHFEYSSNYIPLEASIRLGKNRPFLVLGMWGRAEYCLASSKEGWMLEVSPNYWMPFNTIEDVINYYYKLQPENTLENILSECVFQS